MAAAYQICKHLNIALLLVVALSSFNATPSCYKDLEINFFEESIVLQAFDVYTLNNIYQGQWPWLVRKLRDEERKVPKIIKDKTDRMLPDPMDYPFQKEKAEELLLDTLYQIFSNVMHAYANVEEETVKGMFQFIKEKQKRKLEACFGEGKKKKP